MVLARHHIGDTEEEHQLAKTAGLRLPPHIFHFVRGIFWAIVLFFLSATRSHFYLGMAKGWPIQRVSLRRC